MNSLISMDNGKPLLDAKTAARIVKLERIIKSLKEMEDALRMAILSAMEDSGTVKIETDDLIINYISETDKEQFNSKAFRKDHPDMYDSYISMVKVKPQLRIKLKDKKNE